MPLRIRSYPVVWMRDSTRDSTHDLMHGSSQLRRVLDELVAQLQSHPHLFVLDFTNDSDYNSGDEDGDGAYRTEDAILYREVMECTTPECDHTDMYERCFNHVGTFSLLSTYGPSATVTAFREWLEEHTHPSPPNSL